MIIYDNTDKRIIRISTSQCKKLCEDVYVNALNSRKKQASLTYDKGQRSHGNLNRTDYLKTDKMNTNNGDTYEVPLKGGIISYNITSIKGNEVMHYFKRKFEKKGSRTELSFSDKNGNKELYELVMADSELNQFVNDFKKKVGAVVESKINDFSQENGEKLTTLSIYPVPSSSNFNIEMAKILLHTGFNGMNVQIINTSILRKDTSNLQKDLDFIAKNKEYYDSSYNSEAQYSHQQQMDTDMNKLRAHSNIYKYILGDSNEKIEGLNSLFTKIMHAYYNYNGRDKYKNMSQKRIEKIGELYGRYVSTYFQLIDSAHYFSEIEKKQKGRRSDTLLKAIKYSKGKSIEERTNNIFKIAKQSKSFYQMCNFNLTQPIDVCEWSPVNFQIKKFGNDTRMGLKNYYQPNADELEMVKQEVEKAQNTVVVVFDDNVSGGATLSDICLQLKNLGLNNIIPITFGEMHQQWRIGMTNIGQPKGGFNMN
jgi:predicted hydrocarbon binding protein